MTANDSTPPTTVLGQHSPLARKHSLTLVVGFALMRALFEFLQGALAARSAQGVAYDMRNALYSKIQSLSFSYHDKAQTGQLLTRATSDVEMVHTFVGMGAVQFVSALLMIAGALALLFLTDWRLALIILVIAPLTFALFVVGISSGVNIWKLEQFIQPASPDEKITELTAEYWGLEIYRTIIHTLGGLAWALLLFFVVALIAFVLVKRGEMKAAKG